MSSNNDNNNNNNQNMQQAPVIQPNHFENIINQQTPSTLTTNSSPSSSFQSLQGDFHVGSTNQLFQHNLAPNTSDQTYVPSFCYGVSDQMKPEFSENTRFQSLNSSSSNSNSQNFSLDSVLSTPLSSPAPANIASALIGGGTEDERESFCSNLLRFEIPEGFDFDDFM